MNDESHSLSGEMEKMRLEEGERRNTIEGLHEENRTLRARITDLEKVSDIKSAALVDANQKAIQLTTRITALEAERDDSARRAQQEITYLRAELESKTKEVGTLSKSFEVLAREGLGLSTPLEIYAEAENNEETLSQILVRMTKAKLTDSEARCESLQRKLAIRNDVRREFNSVGHPSLPANPSREEIVKWIKDKAIWETLQPSGQEMNAREWASTCLTCAAEDIESSIKPSTEK